MKPSQRRGGGADPVHELRVNMDDGVQKSCWGITAKAVAGFAFIILLAWLIGGAETTAVVAAS